MSALATSVNSFNGGLQPSKRQAVESESIQKKAQVQAIQEFQKLMASGVLGARSHDEQQTIYKILYGKKLSKLMGANTPSENIGMRVAIDKKNRTSLDKLFNAEDTTDTDHADEVLSRCEEISKSLQSHLSKGAKKSDGSSTGTNGNATESYQQVTQAQLIDACGDTARYLKPYQIVGVNFLILLYRAQVGGGT